MFHDETAHVFAKPTPLCTDGRLMTKLASSGNCPGRRLNVP